MTIALYDQLRALFDAQAAAFEAEDWARFDELGIKIEALSAAILGQTASDEVL